MDSKASIRKLFIAKREGLTPRERSEKSALIAKRILTLQEFKEAHICLLYAAFRHEVATDQMISLFLSQGKRLALPVTDRQEKRLFLREIENGTEDLVISTFGIREPRLDKAPILSPDDIDLFLVPGVAFDLTGTRLGFGGGYYDRLLSRIRHKPILALAYEIQITSSLPWEPFDVKMHKIVTESRIIECEKYRALQGCRTKTSMA